MKLVLICTTPRSGSESFCSALRSGGLTHAYEIAHPVYRAQLEAVYGEDFGQKPVSEILQQFARRPPAKDHIAVKIFAEDAAASNLVQDPSGHGGVLIHLERRDLAAQVVSLVAMWVSGHAIDLPTPLLTVEPKPLERRTVQMAIAFLRQSRRAWRRQAELGNTATVYMEDVISDPKAAMVQLSVRLAEAGVPFDAQAAANAMTASTRYTQDAELKARIRRDYHDLLTPLSP